MRMTNQREVWDLAAELDPDNVSTLEIIIIGMSNGKNKWERYYFKERHESRGDEEGQQEKKKKRLSEEAQS